MLNYWMSDIFLINISTQDVENVRKEKKTLKLIYSKTEQDIKCINLEKNITMLVIKFQGSQLSCQINW